MTVEAIWLTSSFHLLCCKQDASQNYISGDAALAVHTKLGENLAAAEATIAERNSSGTSKARTSSEGGLPYQLLIPSGIGADCASLHLSFPACLSLQHSCSTTLSPTCHQIRCLR